MLQKSLIKTNGIFYISAVTQPGAQSSPKKGDVIVKLDNQNIATYADLSGYINTKRPNDKVDVTILRGLQKQNNSSHLSKMTIFKGIELENISAADKKEIQCKLRCKIRTITNENLMQYETELKGSIIISIDNTQKR
jgi:PDZ domain-containing secreted protein